MKHVVGGWTLSSIWRVQDGRPVTALMDDYPSCAFDGGLTCGVVSNFGGADVGRFPLFARNSLFTTPYLFTTDLRIGREFKLSERISMEFLWEAFNLFNKTNVVDVVNDAFNVPDTTCPAPAGVNPATFGGCITPRSSFLSTYSTGNTLYGARQMQFGAKIRF